MRCRMHIKISVRTGVFVHELPSLRPDRGSGNLYAAVTVSAILLACINAPSGHASAHFTSLTVAEHILRLIALVCTS